MELLAPAGNIEGFKAVLATKPDVIYLGAGDLNARSHEAQFAVEELAELVDMAARQGVKINFTLNVLLRDCELKQALELARQASRAGVAALIVQDKGLIRLLRRELPELTLHASTQCSIGTREQILEAAHLGLKRLVLARELSLSELQELTQYAHSLGLEVEVFTHGATCISVSGQCHMSAWLGGRSANRGECAQPCRKTYQIWEGEKIFRDSAAHLSPKDLSYFYHLPELLALGVDALKIEGRLRSVEYQSQVSAIFKEALVELQAGRPRSEVLSAERERSLQIAFNRGGGYQSSFLCGERDQSFLSARQVGHQGYYLGVVEKVQAFAGILSYRAAEDYLPQNGSQISLKNSAGQTVATAPVGKVAAGKSGLVELQGFHPQVLRELYLPLTVWQQKQVQVPEETLRAAAPPVKTQLAFCLEQVNDAYIMHVGNAQKAIAFSSLDLTPLPQPTGSPLTAERIRQQVGKLGNTPYEMASLDIQAENLPCWRISDLNRLRRAAIDKFHNTEAEVVDDTTKSEQDCPKPEFVSTKYRQFIYLPRYQAGAALPPVQWQTSQLLILPLEELFLTWQRAGSLSELRQGLKGAGLAAYLPPLHAWSTKQFNVDFVTALQHLSLAADLAAWVSPCSGLPELARELGFPGEIFLWQGGQVWNEESFRYLSSQGYHGLMLSPELSLAEQKALAQAVQDSPTRSLLLAYGRRESMFMRFCPVGYSQGDKGCELCRTSSYNLRDEQGLCFPLSPRKYADCSLQIWQSEPYAAPLDSLDSNFALAYNFVEEDSACMCRILAGEQP